MTDEQLIRESILKRGIDATTVFRFVKLLSTPFQRWPAYKTGVIDKDGNTIKSASERVTPQEKSSFTMFHRLVRNVKKLVTKLPAGRSFLVNFAAALFLIREYKENPYGHDLQERFEDFWENNREFINEAYFEYNSQLLSEEVGTTTTAVQIVDKPMKKKKDDDELEEYFMGSRVFSVNTESFMKSRYGKKKYTKYERYVGSDENGMKIREYGRSNPKSGIILKDSTTGTMLFLRRPSK